MPLSVRTFRSLVQLLMAAGLLLAVVIPSMTQYPTLEQAPVAKSPAPSWSAADAREFLGCVAAASKPSWIPAAMVVETRDGSARRVRYSDASVRRVSASWSNESGADDLFVTGACR